MVLGTLFLHEPFFARQIETEISFDNFYVELRGVRNDRKIRLFLSRYSPAGTLQLAFLPDQVDVLIENLARAVAAARAHPPEKRSSSLLIRIIDFLFPDVVFEQVSPMDYTGGTLVVKAEASPNTSSNRIVLHLKSHLEATPKTAFTLENAEHLIEALREANTVLRNSSNVGQ